MKPSTSNQHAVDHFNSTVPVGSPVKLRKDNGEIIHTIVTRPAAVLGGHTPVVWVEGISGAYLLSRVTVAKAEMEAPDGT